jgi:hypothetical protein
MSMLFDSVSRKPNRGLRVRILLIFFIAITFALLNTPRPTRGVTPQACGTNFPLYSSVMTDFSSVDCDTAKMKAYKKAFQDLELQRAAYVCPQECPNAVEVWPPAHITCGPECTPFQLPNGVTRYDGAADAEGTYQCVP